MPRKARLDELSFREQLKKLPETDIELLHNAKSSADIWGRLCGLMGKADTVENRRACYDLWKRKGSRLCHEDCNEVKATFDDNVFMKNTTVDSFATNECESLSRETETAHDFFTNLCDLSKHYGENIIITYTQHPDKTHCTGEVIAVQILCNCISSSTATNIERNNVPNTHSSELIDHEDFIEDKSETDHSSKQIFHDMDNIQSCENNIANVNGYSNDETSISASPAHAPIRLFMSPSSSLPTPTTSIDTSNHNDLEVVSKAVHKPSNVSDVLTKTKNMLSPIKIPDHSILTDQQKNVLSYLQRKSTNSSSFTFDVNELQRIERSKAVIISQSDMNKLKEFQQQYVKRDNKKMKVTTADEDENLQYRKRNLEWTTVIDVYVKMSNDYCVFIYDRHHFTNRMTISNSNQFFMSVDAHCKFKSCTCIFHGTLLENGRLNINYSGKIIHETSETHSRPIRGTRREELRKLTALGATPGAVHLQQLQSMSTANKDAGNRNTVGSSPSVIRKISSEANLKLRRDHDLDKSLRELKIEQATKIFPGETVPGFLQEISTDPLRLVCFTAGGLAVYHQFASTMPLSWDATGSIVINHNKRIYYYELTMSSLSKGGSSLPITLMLSASHGTMDIVHWMNSFIEKYKQVYGFTNPFPKPPVIHSDRASVFLMAGIQVFNQDETMDRYIERCWRIIQGTATKRDLEITVVHTCLGHFMKNIKKNASKDLGKKQIPFGMWLMALLVNSNTLDEMTIVWRNICIVLLSPNQNDQFKMSLSVLSKMAEQMNADPDKTNFVLRNVSVTAKGHIVNNLDSDKEVNTTHDVTSEEESVFHMQSSFTDLFGTIKQQCKDVIKVYDAPQWEALPNNPLFSVVFLNHILKLYMPTAPLWSNLLLGNFSQRYGYSVASTIPQCLYHFGRTTGTSESQMRVLKEAILSKKIYSRVDEVVSKFGEVIEAVEIQFADHIMLKKAKGRLLPFKKQKLPEEQWNKRKKIGKSTTGVYTSKKPPTSLVNMMNNRLLGQNDDAKLDVGQLTQILKFENSYNNCWLNSMLQMLLASGHIVEAIRRFGPVEADLTASKVMFLGNMLNQLINKDKLYTEAGKTIVNAKYIRDHIGYFRWAGINIRPGKQNCVFDFFRAVVVPTLLLYDIDLQYIIDVSMRCSSCQEVSSTGQQTWDYLLVHQTIHQDTLDNVVADLFGPTLEKKTCPKCFKLDRHETSMSIMNCPKDLFIRFEPIVAKSQYRPKLTAHVDFGKIISRNVAYTQSYSCYTLQSFIVFDGEDNDGHYTTYIRYKGDWYHLNDMNIKLITASNIFENHVQNLAVMMAHYTRASEADVFSNALWNVFTGFSTVTKVLPSCLCLNDAANYFAKRRIIDYDPLNLLIIKLFDCSICKRETYVVNRMHELLNMQENMLNVDISMRTFIYDEIKCSSCGELGLTRSLLYELPRFLLLKCRNNEPNVVNFIDERDSLYIRPSYTHPSFKYNVQIILVVLEENDLVYLKKTGIGYSIFNSSTREFELLEDFSLEIAGLASNWIVFVYKTEESLFNTMVMDKKILDQNTSASPTGPEPWIVNTVQGLLPLFKQHFTVESIQLRPEDMNILLDNKGDINDLIIDAHLCVTAIKSPPDHRVLALSTHIVSEIIERRFRQIRNVWLNYDIILCPINQKNHWYLVIFDIGRKLIVQFDSLPTHDIRRMENKMYLMHYLNAQHYLRNGVDINFEKEWKFSTPSEDFRLYQEDSHSCGIHVLMNAKAYVLHEPIPAITSNNVQLYRHQIAEDILRRAEPIIDDDSSSLSDVSPIFTSLKPDHTTTKSTSKQTKQNRKTFDD